MGEGSISYVNAEANSSTENTLFGKHVLFALCYTGPIGLLGQQYIGGFQTNSRSPSYVAFALKLGLGGT